MENQNKKIFCMKCRKKTKNVNPKKVKTKNNRKMLKSLCDECNGRKCVFIKNK